MNRFRPTASRACLEDLSAPISHFAGCRQDHDFMYRQLAQTRHHEPQMDPSFWSRTENVWAGTSARTRASFTQLATGIYGRSAAAIAVVLLIVGLQFMPSATRQTTTTAQGTAPVSEQVATQTASSQNPVNTPTTNSRSKSTKPANTASGVSQNVPAAPTQSAVTTPEVTQQTAPETPETPQTPTDPTPTPEQPVPEVPEQSQPTTGVSVTPDGTSVSVIADDDPAVEVSLPGLDLQVL